MAIYAYRCDTDGEIETRRPIGEAPGSIVCGVCGGRARRVYSSPQTAFSSPSRRAISSAIERSEQSAEKPEVVTSLPPDGRRRAARSAPLTPALGRLPRP